MPYGSKDRRDSLGSMPRRNKRQRNSLSSMQATALTRPALPTCRQSQTRLRIIVHFGLPRTEHAIVRNQQAQKPLKPSPSVGESDTFDDISHFLVLHHLCEALSVRIIAHFVPRRPKRTIIRTRHDQCQPIADHARFIASNKAHSASTSNIAHSASAEAKAPPTARPTASLRTSHKGHCLDNGADDQVFGHLKDTDNGNRAIDEGYRRKCA